jgi:uncharacterized membrane protein YhhN
MIAAVSSVPASPILLIGVLILLVAGFAFSRYDLARAGRMPKIAELPQTVLLIAFAALAWLALARGTPFAALGALICAGVAFGFLGDLFMANVFKQENHILFGMAAFAIGHVLYILAFREIAVRFGLHDLGRYVIALGLSWLLAVVLWFILVRSAGTMQYAALAYALFLASMAGYALGMALQNNALLTLAIGAVLFLLSDALLAARLFSGLAFPYAGDVIWITYIAAQALIVTITPMALAQ